jgi:colicin import membrane protein
MNATQPGVYNPLTMKPMKPRTTFATAAIALILASSLQATPDSRNKDNNTHLADTRQIERNFETIAKAVADARKQATEAIRQRDAALKALQDGNAASERSRKEAETRAAATAKAKADAETASRKQLEARLSEANGKLTNATKKAADLGNQLKAAEASKKAAETQLAEATQKLGQANKALTVQLKTIADARKAAADAARKHAETLKARDAEIDRLRKEAAARKGA